MFESKRQNRRKRSPEERRQQRRRTLRRWGRRIAALMGLVLIAGGLPFLILQGYSALMESDYFALSYVDVEGLHYVEEQALLAAAEEVSGEHLLNVESDRLELIVEQLPFVDEASVERRFPNRLHVVIDEYEPAAIVVDERFWLVDADGQIVMKLDASERREELWQLPLVTGLTRADLQTPQGRDKLQQGLSAHYHYRAAGLDDQQPISEVHIDELLGVSLVVGETGTEVRLGSGRWEERMERLAVVQTSLIRRGMDAAYVLIDHDRELNRVAVGPRSKPGKGDDSPPPQK